MTKRTLTPQQAAKRAKCGRSSIMRALSAGYIRANKNNEGHWEIEPDAVDDWMLLRRSPDRQSPDMTDGQQAVTYVDSPETLIKLAVAEARLQDVTSERDRLAALLEKALAQQSRGIISRIFGR